MYIGNECGEGSFHNGTTCLECSDRNCKICEKDVCSECKNEFSFIHEKCELDYCKIPCKTSSSSNIKEFIKDNYSCYGHFGNILDISMKKVQI